MDLKNKEICRTLQVLLWIWFGVMTSFVATNVVNIAKLQTENKVLKENITTLESRIAFIKEHIISK
jgi:cell division protein FtsB